MSGLRRNLTHSYLTARSVGRERVSADLSRGRSISFWLSWPFTTSGWPVLLTIQKGAKMERTMVPRLWNLLKNLSTDILLY